MKQPNKVMYCKINDGTGEENIPVALFVFGFEDDAEMFRETWEQLHPTIICFDGYMNAVIIVKELWEEFGDPNLNSNYLH